MRSTLRSLRQLFPTRALLLVGFVTVLSLQGAGATDSPFLVQLQDLIDTVELAMYYAKAALLAADPQGFDIYLDEMMETLCPTGDETRGTGPLEDRAAELLVSVEAVPMDRQDQADVAVALQSISAFADLVQAGMESLRSAPSEGSAERVHAVRRVAAYLAAARGGIPFAPPGLVDVRALLPNAERTAHPGDSLQEHADLLLPGGILYLEPGTYELPDGLVIEKSITLQPVSGSSDPVLIALRGGAEDAVLSIGAPTRQPIRVNIRGLTLRGGRDGVSVGQVDGTVSSGSVDVRLEGVSVLDCGRSGVRLGSGEVQLIDCLLAGNHEFGLVIPWTGTARLTACTISDNGTADIRALGYQPTGGIHVTGNGSIDLGSCTVMDNTGPGLWAADAATVSVHSTRIHGNVGDGILVWDRATVTVRDCTLSANQGFGILLLGEDCPSQPDAVALHRFEGEIHGARNRIPAGAAEDGNQRGAVCPSTYGFLVDGE